MGLKICEECGEEVDEAKAFCPDCGNPFIKEEKREATSEFDDYAGTMNFSKSVYKMMLSEMDLDTSQTSGKEQTSKTQEQLKQSIPPIAKQPKKIKPLEIETSPNSVSQEVTTENDSVIQNKKSVGNSTIAVAVVGGLILLILVLALLLIFLYFYF